MFLSAVMHQYNPPICACLLHTAQGQPGAVWGGAPSSSSGMCPRLGCRSTLTPLCWAGASLFQRAVPSKPVLFLKDFIKALKHQNQLSILQLQTTWSVLYFCASKVSWQAKFCFLWDREHCSWIFQHLSSIQTWRESSSVTLLNGNPLEDVIC